MPLLKYIATNALKLDYHVASFFQVRVKSRRHIYTIAHYFNDLFIYNSLLADGNAGHAARSVRVVRQNSLYIVIGPILGACLHKLEKRL